MTILFAEFFDLVKTNLMFVGVSLAVITVPAAVAGMARVTLTMMEGKNHFLGRDFFDAFRHKFLRSLGIGLTAGLAALFAGLSILLYTSLGREYGAALYILAALAVLILIAEQMVASCAFPLLALTDLPYGKILLTAKNLAVSYAGRAFAAAMINVSLFIVSFLLNPGSIIFTVFIEFSFMSFIASYLLYPALQPYLADAGTGDAAE